MISSSTYHAESHYILNKINKVFISCKTKEQLKTGYRYCILLITKLVLEDLRIRYIDILNDFYKILRKRYERCND